MRRLIWPVVIGVIAALACLITPYALLRQCGEIAENFAGEDIVRVLDQLHYAAIDVPAAAYLGCGALVMLLALLLRRQWLGAAIIALHLIIAGVALTFIYTKVNGVPVHTMLKIIVDYALSGAF